MRQYLTRILSFLLVLGLPWSAFGQTASSGPEAVEVDPHLVGWWKLDDSSGKTAKDSSGHGHDATLQEDLSFENQSAPGRIGEALKLDGDGVLVVEGYKGIGGTHPRTVSAWIKTANIQGDIISWGEDDFGKQWRFGFIRNRVGVTPNGGYLYMNDKINDDQWHHVAAVVKQGDPPNLYDSVALYLDGVPATIHDIGLLDLWPIDTGSEMDVTIGRRFKGLLDDVRLYDRALSSKEIEALFKEK